jgi:hypothetical protein
MLRENRPQEGQPHGSGRTWSGGGRKVALLEIMRGSEVRKVSVDLKPVRAYLEARWLRNGALPFSSADYKRPLASEGALLPHIFGVRLERESAGLRVLDVLQGGPADRAGIRPGVSVEVVSGAPGADGALELESGTLE